MAFGIAVAVGGAPAGDAAVGGAAVGDLTMGSATVGGTAAGGAAMARVPEMLDAVGSRGPHGEGPSIFDLSGDFRIIVKTDTSTFKDPYGSEPSSIREGLPGVLGSGPGSVGEFKDEGNNVTSIPVTVRPE